MCELSCHINNKGYTAHQNVYVWSKKNESGWQLKWYLKQYFQICNVTNIVQVHAICWDSLTDSENLSSQTAFDTILDQLESCVIIQLYPGILQGLNWVYY